MHSDDHDMKMRKQINLHQKLSSQGGNEEIKKNEEIKIVFVGWNGRHGLLWTAGWLPPLPGSNVFSLSFFSFFFSFFLGGGRCNLGITPTAR